jgi:coenzyme F420-reducing hydrogenase beta subunit
VRHTELRTRIVGALGREASSWSELFVITELGSRTVNEALEAGVDPKQVWGAVWRVLELPENQR